MKKQKLFILISIILLVALLTACTPATSPQSAAETSSPTAAETATPTPAAQTGSTPDIALPAQARIADDLNVATDQVILISTEPVQWPDSCLGVHRPGEMCAEVITDGFLLVFNTPKGKIEVHTNQTGQAFRIASGPDIGLSKAVDWQRTGGIAGICQQFTIYYSGEYVLQDCKRNILVAKGKLADSDWQKIKTYLEQYFDFNWTTPPSKGADQFFDQYTFSGTGSQTPTNQEQETIDKLIAELAQAVFPSSVPSDSTNSGIQGQVLAGPACGGPVVVGKECPDQPVQALFSVLDENGLVVAQFESDSNGNFQVNLPPGTYTLHFVSDSPFPHGSDQTVVVETNQYSQMTITLDTGIR